MCTLNLMLVHTTKSEPETANFYSLLERLYVFTSGSYVHNKWKIVQHEMSPGLPPIELQKGSVIHAGHAGINQSMAF